MVGAGVGAMMQNLVLVTQNTVAQRDMDAGSSLIACFRSLGGAIGVSALGAGIGEIFLLAAPLGLVALVALPLIREVPTGDKSGIELATEQAAA